MFNKILSKLGVVLGCLATLIILAVLFGISWIATCGIVYLIMLCFDLVFTWSLPGLLRLVFG
jgi:hypothetical protein